MMRKIVFLVLLAALCVGGFFAYNLSRYKSSVKSMTIGAVDFSRLADGSYEGYCNLRLVDAKVRVTVAQGKAAVEVLEHRHGKGYGGEAIVDVIVEKQALPVDVITGCTASSKAIMKAVENACAAAGSGR